MRPRRRAASRGEASRRSGRVARRASRASLRSRLRASASRTTGRAVASASSSRPAPQEPVPSPGPTARAVGPDPGRASTEVASGTSAWTIGRLAPSATTTTFPAPARNAARAARAAAPAIPRAPPTTARVPYVPLCAAAGREREEARRRGPRRPRDRRRSGRKKTMSATTTRPQAAAAGRRRWASFGAPNVTVRSARTCGPTGTPRGGVEPRREVDGDDERAATRGDPGRVRGEEAPSSRGREGPVRRGRRRRGSRRGAARALPARSPPATSPPSRSSRRSVSARVPREAGPRTEEEDGDRTDARTPPEEPRRLEAVVVPRPGRRPARPAGDSGDGPQALAGDGLCRPLHEDDPGRSRAIVRASSPRAAAGPASTPLRPSRGGDHRGVSWGRAETKIACWT